MIFTARIMNRPPNRKYVYGYEKAESIATKILSLIIPSAQIAAFDVKALLQEIIPRDSSKVALLDVATLDPLR